jgi:hypothetical protein
MVRRVIAGRTDSPARALVGLAKDPDRQTREALALNPNCPPEGLVELLLIGLDGFPADHEAAIGVWRTANVARLLPPSAERVARIRVKLADPGACLVIGHTDASRDVLAIALAEPGRAQDGAGSMIPGYGHVSMLFVHPDSRVKHTD